MKKGCLIAGAVGLVLLCIVGAIVFLVFRLTAPMTAEGEKFLATLGSGSVETAYGMTSTAMRTGQSQASFADIVKAYGLDGFESASWSSRNINNDRGTLEGTVRTKKGGSVPLTIEMIKESGTWKVLSIKGPQTGARTGPIIERESPALAVPGTDESAQLALTSLLSLNEALQTKSFDKFHAGISRTWQEQITSAKLLEVFQALVDLETNLDAIKTLSPVFKSPPALNADGILVLEGHYPVEPGNVFFTLKFVNEEKAWKLFGVKVNIGK